MNMMKLNNKTYDTLKWIAMYLLPAAGTLYFALAGIWGLPYGEQVVGTITAVDTFLGVILGISTAQYNKANKAEYISVFVKGGVLIAFPLNFSVRRLLVKRL